MRTSTVRTTTRLRMTAAAFALCTLLAFGITATVAARQSSTEPRVRALTNRTFARTPERMARGRYLVEAVAGCFECHSKLANHPGPAEAPEFIGVGGGTLLIDEPDFTLAAPNISPDVETGAGSWTDDQFARAIREGIGHDGRALFPIMPYPVYKDISDEDLASIVVYIRSIAPVRKEWPKRKIPAMYIGLMNSLPQPIYGHMAAPAADPVSRGRYLVAVAHCHECHTPFDDKTGAFIPGMDFAGGGGGDSGDVSPANITPDPTGIGYYDEALFISAMRTGYVGARPRHLPMPWPVFRNMTDDDLKAVFAYLRTLKPVHHDVDNTEVATYCKRCKGKHGLGEHNDRYALDKPDKLEENSKQ